MPASLSSLATSTVAWVAAASVRMRLLTAFSNRLYQGVFLQSRPFVGLTSFDADTRARCCRVVASSICIASSMTTP